MAVDFGEVNILFLKTLWGWGFGGHEVGGSRTQSTSYGHFLYFALYLTLEGDKETLKRRAVFES